MLYLDYVKLITKLTSAGTLPYEDKYDELVCAIVTQKMVEWLDRTNRSAIVTAREEVLTLKDELITLASRNIGMVNQVQSRREDVNYFAPRKVV